MINCSQVGGEVDKVKPPTCAWLQQLQTQVFDTKTNSTHLCSALSAGSLRSWSPSQGRWLGLVSPLFPSRHARRLGFVAWLKWWSWWWSIGQVWKWWFSQWFENGKGDRKMRILTRVQWTKHIQCRYSGNPGFNKKTFQLKINIHSAQHSCNIIHNDKIKWSEGLRWSNADEENAG